MINWKKIGFYLLISFSLSWITALAVYAAGLQYDSWTAKLIIGALYMPTPALATWVIQKFIYKEGFAAYGWTLKNMSMTWLLLTPAVFVAATLLMFGWIYVLGNLAHVELFGQVIFSKTFIMAKLTELATKAGKPPPPFVLEPLVLFVLSIGGGIIAGMTINLPFTFGEEFGWRGLLLKETQPMGFWKTNVFIGTVWGLWHLPLIVLFGHNYPDHRVAGIGFMVLFCISVSLVMAILRLRTKTILATSAFHGMVNGVVGMQVLFVAAGDERFGSLAGIAGVLAMLTAAGVVLLFDRKFISAYSEL